MASIENQLKEDIVAACKRTSGFLCEYFKVNIAVGLAQLEELEAERDDKDFFEWDWVGEDAPLSETNFVLKLTFNEKILAFCSANFNDDNIIVDAVERLKRKHNNRVKAPAMLCLVEACREIGLVLGKKNLTVECAVASTGSIAKKQGYEIVKMGDYTKFPLWPVQQPFKWPALQR
ncbi:MAG: hypothetical protein R3D88_04560 [Alphaproteobacteria bacterium]|nr:hypothetical protein [Alphaproteobacteria bacterium]